MSKYIIKNCECFVKNGATCYNKLYKPCKDVNNCLLKQIVEMCKSDILDIKWLREDSGSLYDECVHAILKAIESRNTEILEFMNIEETG